MKGVRLNQIVVVEEKQNVLMVDMFFSSDFKVGEDCYKNEFYGTIKSDFEFQPRQ